jgi:hypothetical protein
MVSATVALLAIVAFIPWWRNRGARIDWRRRLVTPEAAKGASRVDLPFDRTVALVLTVKTITQGYGESRTESAVFKLELTDDDGRLHPLAHGPDPELLLLGRRIARRMRLPLVDRCGPAGLMTIFAPVAGEPARLVVPGVPAQSDRFLDRGVELFSRVRRWPSVATVMAMIGLLTLLFAVPVASGSWSESLRWMLVVPAVAGLLLAARDARLHGTTTISVSPETIMVKRPWTFGAMTSLTRKTLQAVRVVKLPYRTKTGRTYVDLLGEDRLLARLPLPEDEAIHLGALAAGALGLLAEDDRRDGTLGAYRP